MNKKKETNKDFEEFLVSEIKEIKEIYGIGSITVQVVKSNSTWDLPAKKAGGIIPLAINYCHIYKRATVWYYPSALDLYKEKNFSMLRQGLTHEVAHILTEKLAKLALDRFAREEEIKDEVETLTESIAQLGRKMITQKDGIINNKRSIKGSTK